MLRASVTLLMGLALAVSFGGPAGADIPWNRLPNVEPSKVTDDVKTRAAEVMKKENCYYECSASVYECLSKATPSKTALRIGGFIVRQVIRGKPDKDIRQDLMERARSVHPFKTAQIDLSTAACLGAPDAPVVVVAFTDFECPFCRIVSPILRRLIPSYGKKVAYCFKYFPVKGHGPLAVTTSLAGVAAAKLGKFWDFHDIMYKHWDKHTDGDIKSYVEQLGLDWSAFEKEAEAKATKKLVAGSKREGLKLGVKSTPTLFINGKRYHAEKSEVELKDRIEEELDLVQ